MLLIAFVYPDATVELALLLYTDATAPPKPALSFVSP
jgi:hypothetical protein